MKLRILIYGLAGKREDFGFPTESDFREWMHDILTKYHGRFRYTDDKEADVIVLSRDGWAHGHFEIDHTEKPKAEDLKAYPGASCVYIVRSRVLYPEPVQLADLGITGIQFGKLISEQQFDEIKKAAGA